MKIFAYLLGIPVYWIIGFLMIPISMLLFWLKVKTIIVTTSFLWLGIFISWAGGFLLINSMKYIFELFESPVPLLFVVIVTFSILMNNYYRYKTRQNKDLQLGYIIGEFLSIPIFYYYMIKSGMEFIYM